MSRGDLVSVSVTGAGRDPAAFPGPDRFDVRRGDAGQNLAFARGPHSAWACTWPGWKPAPRSARSSASLPGLRLDPDHPAAPRGLVFRKPPALPVRWDAARGDGGPCSAGRPGAPPGVPGSRSSPG